ncbi:class I SAM-dependent methyltransferase [Nanoarchaeota archaeon]
MASVLDKRYHDKRMNRIDLRYRLTRKTSEVRRVIEERFNKSDYSKLNCLDVGTADGLMLSRLNKIFKFNKAIGIDLSKELIKLNKDRNIKLKIGDAEKLRFDNNSFDIVIACAVIEHVDNPNKMLSECYRVLRKNGILILTVLNPIHDWVATKIGYYKKGSHIQTFNLKSMSKMLKSNHFKITHLRYFMISPLFKLPLENKIESLIMPLGLGKLMANQIIVGKK